MQAVNFLVFSALLVHTTALSSRSAVLPKMDAIASQLAKTQLTFQVAIGDTKNSFPLNDLTVELDTGRASRSKQQQQQSKADCTGLFEANLVQDPYFINTQGQQRVGLQDCDWRVVWNNNHPYGFLVCSMHVPMAVQRTSGAVLDRGRTFLYHRLWSKPSLEYERQRRVSIQARAGTFRGERDDLVQKLATNEPNNTNVWTKLKTYGQAYTAARNLWDSGWRGAKFTPMYDDQVLELSANVIVSTRGRVFRVAEWSKDFRVREDDLLFLGEDQCRDLAYIGECRVDFAKVSS